LLWKKQNAERSLEHARHVQRVLYELSRLTGLISNISSYCASIHELLSSLVECKNLYVVLWDKTENTLVFPYDTDEGAGELEQVNQHYPFQDFENALTGRLLKGNQTLILSRQEIDTHSAVNPSTDIGPVPHWWVGIPLHNVMDDIIGGLVVQNYHADKPYSAEDVELIEIFCRSVAMGFDRLLHRISLEKQLQQSSHLLDKLSFESSHDALTGLKNRAHLNQSLALYHHQLQQQELHELAVIFIDLDNFKPVNDQHGHDVGDQLLRNVAKRLTQCIRHTDVAARVGGDEFVLLLPGARAERCQAIGNSILQTLQAPIQHGELTLTPCASVGAALFHPDRHRTVSDLLRDADQAMYAAKRAGRNRFVMNA